MPIINRLPINSDNDDEQYKALFNRQAKNDKKYDTTRNYHLFSMGSTVAVQQEDGGLWTHGTVVGRGDPSHKNRSYTIRVTKIGCIITRKSKYIKAKPITAEQYLRDQLTQHMEDPLDKILKQHEPLSPCNVQNNDKDRRKEEIDVNNHNDTWTSIAQRKTK